MLQKIKTFVGEVQSEMKRVSWPKRDEVIGSATVVLVLVAIVMLVTGVLDNVFEFVIFGILGLG